MWWNNPRSAFGWIIDSLLRCLCKPTMSSYRILRRLSNRHNWWLSSSFKENLTKVCKKVLQPICSDPVLPIIPTFFPVLWAVKKTTAFPGGLCGRPGYGRARLRSLQGLRGAVSKHQQCQGQLDNGQVWARKKCKKKTGLGEKGQKFLGTVFDHI